MTGASRDEQKRAAPRSAARLAAVQALYQMDVARTGLNAVLAEFTKHRFGREAVHYGDTDEPFFQDIVTGAVREQQRIDPMLNEHLAEGWRLSRIDSILRAILRSGAYELIARDDIPAKVIINEYIDVAHAFLAGEESGVVNGVLDHLARLVRPGEF